MRVGDSFRIVGLVQARGGAWVRVADAIGDFLRQTRESHPTLLTNMTGPFLALGRQDAVAVMDFTDLELGTRMFSACMSHVSEHTQGVARFSYITGFLWDWADPSPSEPDVPYCGLLLVKFADTDRYYSNVLITRQVHDCLWDCRSQVDGGSLGWELWGGFSWHECLGLVRADDYRTLLEVALRVNSLPDVVLATAIPLVERGPTNGRRTACLAGVEVLTRIGVGNASYRDGVMSLDNLAADARRRITHYGFGRYPLLAIGRWDATQSLIDFCAETERVGLGHHASELLFTGPSAAATAPVAPLADPDVAPDQSVRHRTAATRPTDFINESSIAHLKLLALRNHIALVEGNSPDPLMLLPPGLSKKVDTILQLHRERELTDEAVLYFISEIEAALIERTAGAALDPLENGGAPVWHVGGCQRLLLACERLLVACFRHYAEQELSGVQGIQLPMLLAFFDYNRGVPHRPLPPLEAVAAGSAVPIILRLPQMKYKPWLWPLAIGALAQHCEPPQHPDTIGGLRLSALAPVLPTHRVDNFVTRFVSRENYGRLLASDLHLHRPAGKDKILVNQRMEEYLIARLAALRARAESLSHYRQKTETARQWISSGEVKPGVLDTYDGLVGFLNGYLSLDERVRRRTRAFVSFVITLNKSGIPGERRTT
jgi:hypothetical protein